MDLINVLNRFCRVSLFALIEIVTPSFFFCFFPLLSLRMWPSWFAQLFYKFSGSLVIISSATTRKFWCTVLISCLTAVIYAGVGLNSSGVLVKQLAIEMAKISRTIITLISRFVLSSLYTFSNFVTWYSSSSVSSHQSEHNWLMVPSFPCLRLSTMTCNFSSMCSKFSKLSWKFDCLRAWKSST